MLQSVESYDKKFMNTDLNQDDLISSTVWNWALENSKGAKRWVNFYVWI